MEIKENSNIRFGAFVITYEREKILPDTLNKIFDQTYPPEEIWIIDNSETDNTLKMFQSLKDDRVQYFKVGYNSGPSGGANAGLKILAERGFDWIFWGDDDDPPIGRNRFENLLKIAANNENIGIAGMVGGKFIKSRGRTRSLYNYEMKGITDVDMVAGGQIMIINAEIPKAGIFPTSKLFFGFEELDFCLKVKGAGFRIVFDGGAIRKGRELVGKTNPNYRSKNSSFGREDILWRQYYSIRNMLYILSERKIYSGYYYFLIKNLIKIPVAFIHGYSYGVQTMQINLKAVYHHWINRYGFLSKENL